jgi:methyl-accepting chemotaxis protein
MSRLKNLGLSVRLSLYISIVALVCIVALVLIVRNQTMKLAAEDASKIAEETTLHYSAVIRETMGEPLSEARAMATSLSSVFQNQKEQVFSRDQINSLLQDWLKSNPSLFAAFVGFEPNVFDGRDAEFANTQAHDETGRFVPYWYRDGSGGLIVEPLNSYTTDDYYQVPFQTKREAIVEPYLYSAGGREMLMTSLVVPIIGPNGQSLGIIGVDVLISYFSDIFHAVTLYDSGYLNLFSENGAILASKNEKIEGEKLADVGDVSSQYVSAVGAKKPFNLEYYSKNADKDRLVFGYPINFEKAGSKWMMTVNIPTDEIYASAYEMAWTVAFVGIGTILLLVIAVIFIARSISRPVNMGLSMAEDIAKGDLSKRLNLDRGDEIGKLGNALDQMADSLSKSADAVEQVAKGNLSINIELASPKDQLGLSLQKMVADMNDVMGQVQVAGSQIADGSTQVADSSQSLSQGATEAAASLEEITSSMAQMNTTIRMNADNASQASQISNEVTASARQGDLHMEQMVKAMEEINDSSQNVAKIIKVIDEIAFQTNLLALNAAVEAARAGQHGKGFAVVAEEVRNLAARSAKAANETAELIDGSVVKVKTGAEIADKTADALKQIVTGVGKVTDLVTEISAASNEQAEGISQVNEGLGQIDQVTQQNTANAEEGAAAAEELSGQSDQLRQQLQRFQLKGQETVNYHQPQSIPRGTTPAVPKQEKSAKTQVRITLDDNNWGRY